MKDVAPYGPFALGSELCGFTEKEKRILTALLSKPRSILTARDISSSSKFL